MPHRSGVALEWRLKKGRYNLIGSKCPKTGELYFPARNISKAGVETEEYVFSGEGEIITYTIISAAPGGFEDYAPYVIAIVKLKEGPMISAQVVNPPEEVEVGKKVRPVFRKVNEDGESGIIHYGFKFELE